MNIKKIVVFFSMMVLLFSLTACSDGQEHVDFSYTDAEVITSSVYLAYNLSHLNEATKVSINNTEGQEVYQTGISNFETVEKECGEFVGYHPAEGGNPIMVDIMKIDTSTEEGQAVLEQYISMIDATVEENGPNVVVTLQAVYEDAEVEQCFVYAADKESAYSDNMTGECVIPYKPSEITLSEKQTMGKKMAKAGANTLMGMGSVFVILIFIAIVIGQFERVSKAIMAVSSWIEAFLAKRKEKRAAKKAAKQKSNEDQAENVVSNDTTASADNQLMNDSQLVAVITAAIMAQNAANGISNDRLVVRSIRKAKRY